MDVGFGFGQVLPVLLSCVEDIDDASTMRESLFIIEEPRVHLHQD